MSLLDLTLSSAKPIQMRSSADLRFTKVQSVYFLNSQVPKSVPKHAKTISLDSRSNHPREYAPLFSVSKDLTVAVLTLPKSIPVKAHLSYYKKALDHKLFSF